jgi:hypothetical protein
MTGRRSQRQLILTGLLACAMPWVPRVSLAFPQLVDQARSFGAKDCTFCHSTPRGMTGWNKRGQWLIKTKLARKADRIDVQWLKEYVPAPEKRRTKKRR